MLLQIASATGVARINLADRHYGFERLVSGHGFTGWPARLRQSTPQKRKTQAERWAKKPGLLENSGFESG